VDAGAGNDIVAATTQNFVTLGAGDDVLTIQAYGGLTSDI
jgi:hypothetical protein